MLGHFRETENIGKGRKTVVALGQQWKCDEVEERSAGDLVWVGGGGGRNL